jgi:LmbE family N-acetylglucosaminyl deacetylase
MQGSIHGWRARRRAAIVAVVVSTAMLSGLRAARASEPGPHAQPSLNGALVRPHLDTQANPAPPQIHLPNAHTARLLMSQELVVPPHLRLMVFAPHPDDETLAAGGLTQRVLTTGGQVRVVFVTNGDGYVDGVRREVRRVRTSTTDFIQYGERRHEEALRALAHLGLATTDGVFLGFPDDGIDDLWAGHWSTRKPYTSPYTRFDRPAYKESLSQQVEYAGTDLENEITRTLRDFRPDWVLMPDPRDRHPDHCTTGVFVLDALRQLRVDSGTQFGHTRALTYLVHYPDYPASPTWVREIAGAGVGGSSTAGRALSAARWLSLPLVPSELARKREALGEYQSQVLVMQPFLKQFLVSSELFGQLDAAQVETVPHEYALRFRRRQ